MSLDIFLIVKRNGERLDAAFWHNAPDICAWFENNLKSVADGNGYPDPDVLEPVAELEPPKKGECAGNYYYPVTKQEYERLLNLCRNALTKKNSPSEIPLEIQPNAHRNDLDAYWENIELTVDQLEDAEPEINWNNDVVEFMASY